MGSTRPYGWDWQPPPPPAIADFTAPTEIEPVTTVWVLLDELITHGADRRRSVPEGLSFTGRARGLLKTRSWLRSSRGLWLALVNYQVDYVDGRPRPRLFRDQLVPAYALVKRDDNRPIG